MAMMYVLTLGAPDLLQRCLGVLEKGLHHLAAKQEQPSEAEGLMLECIVTAISVLCSVMSRAIRRRMKLCASGPAYLDGRLHIAKPFAELKSSTCFHKGMYCGMTKHGNSRHSELKQKQ